MGTSSPKTGLYQPPPTIPERAGVRAGERRDAIEVVLPVMEVVEVHVPE